jgi:hypothetical protein
VVAAPPEDTLAAVIGADDESPAAAAALENARAIAAALAAGDWAEARRLGPTDRSRTDAQLEAGYGPVTDVTLIPARVTDRGARIDLRLGLVAHEAHDTGPATAVMCVHWSVNPTTHSLQRISSVRLRLEPGLVDPATVADDAPGHVRHLSAALKGNPADRSAPFSREGPSPPRSSGSGASSGRSCHHR